MNASLLFHLSKWVCKCGSKQPHLLSMPLIRVGSVKNMGQGKSSVIIKILVIAAIYFILVLLLVQLVRILDIEDLVTPLYG